MKKLVLGFAIMAGLVFSASPLWALGISLDLPVSYSFDDGGKADSVNGFKAGIALPLFPVFGVGVGYEAYEAKDEDNGVEATVEFNIFDLFLEIPFPFLNLGIGAGWGTHKVKVDDFGYDEKGDVSQWFITLGYPIIPLIDVHAGYHNVSAEELAGGVDVSGEMWSLGVRVGF